MFVFEKFPAEMYDSAGIRALEEAACQILDVTPEALMQRAAIGALTAAQTFYAEAESIAIVCGKGNNAGDGLVLAQLFQQLGLEVTLYHLTALDDLAELPKKALQDCQALGIELEAWHEDIDWDEFDLIVDAILGTGIQGPVRDPYESAIDMINESNSPVLALDVPSGVDSDTGHVSNTAIIADTTITFLAFKQGLSTGVARDYVGELFLDDLDIPAELFEEIPAEAYRLSRNHVLSELAPRLPSAHKGHFGHVLVVGGDLGLAGAVCLAAEGALRSGAGLVSVITRPEHVPAVVARHPEIMCYGVNKDQDIRALLERATVIVVGPGLGSSEWSAWLWTQLVATEKPMLVDASALDYLAEDNERRDNWILTPHPGEASRLLACSIDDIESDRYSSVAALQEKFGGVAVLKGAGTLIKSPAKGPWVCPYGNPGMASGGMGDCLSGIIAGLMAQELSLAAAATCGVVIHALSADQASEAGERGLLASDLMPYIQNFANPELLADDELDDDELSDEDDLDDEDDYDEDDDDYDEIEVDDKHAD